MLEKIHSLVLDSNATESLDPPDDRRSRSPWILLLAILTITIWGATPALSQVDTSAPSPANVADTAEEVVEEVDPEQFEGVEEMMVEARRRSENIQKIGESVSSFSGTDIIDSGLTNFNDLQYQVPSLFSGSGLTRITLRGVGSEIVGPGVDPGFSVHVNGVFSAREGTGLINFFDIERVDVLRGPQGTLWGRNSTGGAINIVTKKADFEFDAEATAEYEWFRSDADGFLITGVINMPIVEDELALRVALLTTLNDGQFENQTGNHSQRVQDAAATALRASLRWRPHEDLTIDLVASWLRSNGAGGARKLDGEFAPPSGPGTTPLTPIAAGPGIDYTGADPNPSSDYKGSANEPQRSDATVWTATLLIEWESEDFDINSITGYQSTDFFLHRDQDLSSLPIQTLDLTDESRQISQELIFTSTWDFPVEVTAGGIYQYDWTPRTQADIFDEQASADSVPLELFPALPITPVLLPFGLTLVDSCPIPSLVAFSQGNFGPDCPAVNQINDTYDVFTKALVEVKNHVFGLYGHLSYEIIEDLTLSVGGRYSYTHRNWKDDTVAQTYFAISRNQGVQILVLGADQSENWQTGTWKVGIEWEATDDNLFWVSVGTGARAGGFNFAQKTSFKQEEILAVEAGIKNSFLENLITFNITGFWYDWTDVQINSTVDGIGFVTNIDSAISYGFELDFRAIPAPNLILNGSFGWLEAEFGPEEFDTTDSTRVDFTQPVLTRTFDFDHSGGPLPRSPRFTASFGVMYIIEAGRWGSFAPRVDYYYRHDVQFRQFDNSNDVGPAYSRVDARIYWYSESEQFWMEVFGRNLGDVQIETNLELVGGINRAYSYDNPRSGGMRFGYNF